MLLNQSTACNRPFLMVLASDHISPATGLTVTVLLSKNGAAFAAAAGAVTEIANGWYNLACTAADTNTVGALAIHATAATADPTDDLDQVNAPVDVEAWKGTAVPTPAAAGIPDVNVKNWSGGAVLVPATSGVPIVNAGYINNVATTPVVAVNPAIGTTQPLNFTGVGAAALVKCDMIDVLSTPSAGAAGYVGIDWSKISNPAGAVNLAGTTISSGQSIASVTGAVGSAGSVTGAVTVGTNNDKSGYSLTPTEEANIAAALLKFDNSTIISGEAADSPLNALRLIRNRWSIAGSVLTVYKEDGVTVAFTKTVTATVGANPITGTGA